MQYNNSTTIQHFNAMVTDSVQASLATLSQQHTALH